MWKGLICDHWSIEVTKSAMIKTNICIKSKLCKITDDVLNANNKTKQTMDKAEFIPNSTITL